jgi:hemerythrin
LEACEKEFQEENLVTACKLASGDFLTFLVDWLGSHIQNTDMKLGRLFNYAENKCNTQAQALEKAGVRV